MCLRNNLIVAIRRSKIPRRSFKLLGERLIIEKNPRILSNISLVLQKAMCCLTWYFLFHLNSNCRILCIIPSNSEFLTKLINAALGLVFHSNEAKCKPFDTAYFLFEFSSSHRIGSGPFLSVLSGRDARVGRNAFIE
jgi:hypothetical protein